MFTSTTLGCKYALKKHETACTRESSIVSSQEDMINK